MRLFSAFLCALALSTSAAAAAEPVWRFASLDGVVRVAPAGKAQHAAHVGESLAAGDVVTTGADGRATLQNGLQTITMAANSRMKVAEDLTNAMTRILQDMGSLLFQVDKRGAPHFRVETPLLAAVVKGTTFTVSVGGEGGVVDVTEGLVEVRAADGGAYLDVPGGKAVRIDRKAPSVIIPVAAALSKDYAPPPLNFAAAPGGLIDGANVLGIVTAQSGLLSAHSLAPAQTTTALLNGVGLGGDLFSTLGFVTNGTLGAVNGLGLADVNVALGQNGGLASIGANLGAGLTIVDFGVGGTNGLANVGASLGNGALANVNLGLAGGGASNVNVGLGGGLASIDAGLAGENTNIAANVAGLVGVSAGGASGLGITVGRLTLGGRLGH